MLIVSDTSPISNLLKINKLSLLRKIYQSIVIPEAVYRELIAAKSFDITLQHTPDWVTVKSIKNILLYQKLLTDLDEGEAQAIALALELSADVLLIDERRGRLKALSLGIQVTGVVCIWLTAKDLQLIPAVKPLLEDLEREAGFWLSTKFRSEVLALANEI